MAKALVKRDQIRALACITQSELQEIVTTFGGYVDVTGAHATSTRGLVVSVNKAIKAHYGLAREEMPRGMLLHVASLLERIIGLIDHGMKGGATRAEIKSEIRDAIRKSAESYHALEAELHVYH